MDNLKEQLEENRKLSNSFAKIQAEKSFFLGEYKERILGALNKDQIIEDDIYPEILELMASKEAKLLKLSRDVDLKKLKPYIGQAEKMGLKYQLVDGLLYKGEIGLVVVSDSAVENQKESLVIRDMDQDFIDSGLGEIFSKNRGAFLCSKHYEQLNKTLPNYINEFKKIDLLGKLIGRKCPICQAEKERRRK